MVKGNRETDYTNTGDIRVVLDTNLFIASYWNRSTASAKIVDACIDGRCGLKAYYTDEISRELDRILGNIKAGQEFRDKVEQFRQLSVKLPNAPAAEQKTIDPEDQKFINCAVAVEADYLVSNDEHLLTVYDLGRTLVVKPSTFWREVGCRHLSSSGK